MKSAAQRIAAYEARMLSSLIDPVLTAVQAQQVQNFNAYVTDFCARQIDMRDILNQEGVVTAQFLAYEAYNGELYHAYQTLGGPALTLEATTITTKYTTLGLTAATLKMIALNVYAIIVP